MTTVTSPVAGRAIPLAEVPDPAFAEAVVGPGVAVEPPLRPCTAVAPVDGILVSLSPNAYVVVDDRGRGVLTHLGLDTVQLDGQGFEPLANKGDTVRRGDPVVRWDPAAVAAAGKSPVCPVVALQAGADALSGIVAADIEVRAGDPLFGWN
ncbi:PTS glucose transporter subunit IIA [Streptomyces carpaticus]|uniref:PTS system, glucose subfamily, IIA component n=1 Tax=Streptomyces harbinensis TaxID=1176198 RepID=A0A1I6QY92_9ACTN|nr:MULTISPECIES: PTS glucose transporter subunit IIA [Streptomyces]MCK1815494.1 PTS glucose transporter subunit IIA [Streptomyces sp. XM4011]QKV67716.1 PTS glucose transporter subunit IIA [Streptomyces harbinensis]UWM48001.1 PTS glucose transporter subunit IIA [Streptomyces carpaticus]SFS57449.1 PTS system, glucose subfamily, IIA component [Streptomyces harbinensis]